MAKILIAEEDRRAAAAVTTEIRLLGHEVYNVTTAANALEHLENDAIDVLLANMQLRLRGGGDLLSAVTRISPKTRCVLMSVNATANDYKTAVERGAVDVLNVPFAPGDLERAISRALESSDKFHGIVHGLDLTDILQVYHQSRRSVVVRAGSETHEIFMREGQVIHAVAPPLQGRKALRAILGRTSGSIDTRPFESCAQTIDSPFQPLLLDVLRENDEEGIPQPNDPLGDDELLRPPASHGGVRSVDDLDLSALDDPALDEPRINNPAVNAPAVSASAVDDPTVLEPISDRAGDSGLERLMRADGKRDGRAGDDRARNDGDRRPARARRPEPPPPRPVLTGPQPGARPPLAPMATGPEPLSDAAPLFLPPESFKEVTRRPHGASVGEGGSREGVAVSLPVHYVASPGLESTRRGAYWSPILWGLAVCVIVVGSASVWSRMDPEQRPDIRRVPLQTTAPAVAPLEQSNGQSDSKVGQRLAGEHRAPSQVSPRRAVALVTPAPPKRARPSASKTRRKVERSKSPPKVMRMTKRRAAPRIVPRKAPVAKESPRKPAIGLLD